ncbi:MAG: hypothetical protein DELT_02564 [Desulfovibrio sp.]
MQFEALFSGCEADARMEAQAEFTSAVRAGISGKYQNKADS